MSSRLDAGVTTRPPSRYLPMRRPLNRRERREAERQDRTRRRAGARDE